jgi:hypothetical protein
MTQTICKSNHGSFTPNSLAHVVGRTFPGPDECCRYATFRPGNWNPTTTRDFTTRTSLRTRGFISETWLRFCGSPGVRGSRPCGLFWTSRKFVPSVLRRYRLFNPQVPTAPEHIEPVPTAIGHHHTPPSYDLLSLDRTRLLISSPSLT